MKEKQHWQDWIIVLLGLWVFVSPWILPHSMVSSALFGGAGGAAMWNFWIAGGALIAIGLVSLLAFSVWEEWVNLALGAWLFASPWLLGFSLSAALTWSALVAGALVVLFAAWSLGDERGPRALTK